MREIWANYLLPKALKSCPKSKKIAKSGHTDRNTRRFRVFPFMLKQG